MRVDAGLLQIVRDGAIDWPERGRVLLVGPASERADKHSGEVFGRRYCTCRNPLTLPLREESDQRP